MLYGVPLRHILMIHACSCNIRNGIILLLNSKQIKRGRESSSKSKTPDPFDFPQGNESRSRCESKGAQCRSSEGRAEADRVHRWDRGLCCLVVAEDSRMGLAVYNGSALPSHPSRWSRMLYGQKHLPRCVDPSRKPNIGGHGKGDKDIYGCSDSPNIPQAIYVPIPFSNPHLYVT